MALEPGTIIGDRYCTTRRLGVGGMGEVWAARDNQSGIEVAVKIMLPAGMLSREVYARFKREAQVLSLIRSEYVASVLDFMSDKQHGLTLVMQLIHGQALSTIIANQGKLSVEAMVDIATDVTFGLRDLHASKVVHRDLKPGNIVLNPRRGDRARAIIIDFGVSRILSDPGEEEITAITHDDRVLGTLEYMAPEQIIGSRTATATADLYALGAMMYRAVAGHHCFGDLVEGKLVAAKLNQDAPPLEMGRSDPAAIRFAAAVARLLSRHPRDRFGTTDELLAEFDAIRDLANATQTAPLIEVSMVPSDEDEAPTESLSLDAQSSQMVAAARSAEPSSSPSTPSGTSLSAAVAYQDVVPAARRSPMSLALILVVVVVVAAVMGGVVGASIATRGSASRSGQGNTQSAQGATASAVMVVSASAQASTPEILQVASAAPPVASVPVSAEPVASTDLPAVPAVAAVAAKAPSPPPVSRPIQATSPAPVRKPPPVASPATTETPPPAPTPAPAATMYIPEGL